MPSNREPVPVGISLPLYLTLYALLIVAYVSVLFYMARSRANAVAHEADPCTLI